MKSGRKTKKQPIGTSVIVREQIQLLKAVKEIGDAIQKCQQYRNKLVVNIVLYAFDCFFSSSSTMI